MQLTPFKLERYFARYEFNVEFSLCSSDCESMTIGELLALEPSAAERFNAHRLGYTESSGAPTLRQEITRIYRTIQPEEVLVFAGAEEAIYLFMHAALQPGDHLIVHWPCYQSLHEVAAALGVALTRWEARPENNWTLDLDELRGAIRPNTRAVVINMPHNPTGFLASRVDFVHLHAITQAHGLLLFSDEVYRESEHDPALRLEAACDLNPLAISLGVTSKTYGLPGLRIGWIATHQHELLRRIASLKDYTTICSAAPSEFLAELALRHRDTLANRSLEIIRRNLDILDEFFTRHAKRFEWRRPSAGPIAFPRLIDGEIEGFCDSLVRQAGVLLLPGTMYDHLGNHFRIGFGRKNLPQAIERLEAFLDH